VRVRRLVIPKRRQRYQAVQLLANTPYGRAFVMMARSMQVKSGGRGASMGLGFDVGDRSMSSMKRVYAR
jgi:hypothetical protein